jgi:hypothetical protein
LGSLQVTCSRLGISLRRPRVPNGSRLLPLRAKLPKQNNTATFSVCVNYNGKEQAVELPLTPAMVGQLALEASSRNQRISEFAKDLLLAVTEAYRRSTQGVTSSQFKTPPAANACYQRARPSALSSRAVPPRPRLSHTSIALALRPTSPAASLARPAALSCGAVHPVQKQHDLHHQLDWPHRALMPGCQQVPTDDWTQSHRELIEATERLARALFDFAGRTRKQFPTDFQ